MSNLYETCQKVQLLFDNRIAARRDWLALDPYAAPDDPAGRTACLLLPTEHNPGLAAFIEANEAEEILADGVLERYPLDRHEDLLKHWVSRLRSQGSLTIVGIDARHSTLRYNTAGDGMEAWNKALLSVTANGMPTCSLISADWVSTLFAKVGLKVTRMEYQMWADAVYFRITGVREV